MSEREHRYPAIVRAVLSHPWVIRQVDLEAVIDVISGRVAGIRLTEEEIHRRIAGGPGSAAPYLLAGVATEEPPEVLELAAGPTPQRTSGRTIAVLPLYGVLIPRANLMTEMSGGTSLERFGAALAQVTNDPSVDAIVIDVDSPGGAVDRTPETAALVREAAKAKPVVAVANTLAASAAYWIASQADELVASPSAMLGSIGVLTTHEDWSAAAEAKGLSVTYVTSSTHKAEGHPYGPLADETRAYLQDLVDTIHASFTAEVAKGRGVSVRAVRGEEFGQGRTLLAARAVEVGMADRIGTLDETIARVARGKTSPGPRAGAQETAGLIEAQADEQDQSEDTRQGELLAQIQGVLRQTSTRLKEARTHG